MDDDDDREADAAADEALINCALAARIHGWELTQNELRILYGRSAGLDAARRLREPPFQMLTPYQVARVRAWHVAQREQPLSTALRLAAEYASTGDSQPCDDTKTLRAIAYRAGVHSELRLAALEVCCGWRRSDAVQALRLMTAGRPAYDDVYAAFEAEAARVWLDA